MKETINHIASECLALAQNRTKRHDSVAKALHWSLCKKHQLACSNKWYEHQPEEVMENDQGLQYQNSQKTEEAITKNENVLRPEKEKAEKARMMEELKEKVERLTEGGMQMERNIRDLERLNQGKERQIAEMEKLGKEIALKAKETEKLIRENEEKDSTLIILESRVVVLEMETETLNHDLKKMENDRNATKVQLNKLNADLERLREESRRKQNNFESLQKENDKNLRINSLEDELAVLTVEKQRAEESLQQLEECKTDIVERKKELEKLKEQNFQRDREILRLENECPLKQEEVIGLLKEIKSVAAEKVSGKLNGMTRGESSWNSNWLRRRRNWRRWSLKRWRRQWKLKDSKKRT
ncbi:uncharacterized protein [Macrobrachium rosenbergii]|uniref:uncharacterized protein n=1 Tax=Macrobrachium rosenbergii TaxID=79674 RepID=UPI0034D70DB3